MPQDKFKALFSDIGGVLGTNGWDTDVREKVCAHFQFDSARVAARHRLMFDSYERGFMSFDDYLRQVFLKENLPVSLGQLRELAYAQSVAWPDNIAFFGQVKARNSFKLALISNEGQGITEHRVAKFQLRELADFMIISHFVHMRKPDRMIWQLALNLVQLTADQVIYVDDRSMFVDIAAELGFTAIQHTSLETTAEKFRQLGLQID